MCHRDWEVIIGLLTRLVVATEALATAMSDNAQAAVLDSSVKDATKALAAAIPPTA